MEITFKVEGLDRLQKAPKVFKEHLTKQITIALDASGRQVTGEMKRSILEGGKSGRVYKRRSVLHRSSAPGEAPASDTGRLVNSIAHYVVPRGFMVIINAGRGLVNYALALEHGTRKMGARPFFFPAVEKCRQWIQKRLNEAVGRAIRDASKK